MWRFSGCSHWKLTGANFTRNSCFFYALGPERGSSTHHESLHSKHHINNVIHTPADTHLAPPVATHITHQTKIKVDKIFILKRTLVPTPFPPERPHEHSTQQTKTHRHKPHIPGNNPIFTKATNHPHDHLEKTSRHTNNQTDKTKQNPSYTA